MRYFIDAEFIEDGSTIDLISIGIVAEDGREYYAQSAEFNDEEANPWVKDNVLPHLVACPDLPYGRHFLLGGQCLGGSLGKVDCPWRSRAQIASEILAFMDIEKYGKPELWGYYSAYDHVAFCQLFGTMMDLPKGFPMYTRDIKQWCDALGNPRLPKQENDEHNALSDARWNRVMWDFLDVIEKGAFYEQQTQSN